MEFLWFALLGMIAGWLAGLVMKTGGLGALGNMILGVLGAVVGGYLFRHFGISPGGGLLGSIVTATVGAVVLIVVIRLVKRI
jgi:uncharacterized membrane protein YeaQ/YmgE (transglycosylase-associated protein family)